MMNNPIFEDTAFPEFIFANEHIDDNFTEDLLIPHFQDQQQDQLHQDQEKIAQLQQQLEESATKLSDANRQLEHHKALSEQLQAIALEDGSSIVNEERPAKRKYTYNEDSLKMRSFISEHMNDKSFAQDLVNGVGLRDISISQIPKSLLRAYIAFRYKNGEGV